MRVVCGGSRTAQGSPPRTLARAVRGGARRPRGAHDADGATSATLICQRTHTHTHITGQNHKSASLSACISGPMIPK